ncbi:hypothetical protein D3C74_310350 [compost metagenome]
MDEYELVQAINKAERSDNSLEDFIFELRDHEIACDGYDDSLDCPYSTAIECDQYDFIEDGEEAKQ